jgi:hypothetical protein
MDIKRLKKLSGITESVDLEEQVGNEGLLRSALRCLMRAQDGDTSGCEEVIEAIKYELGETEDEDYYDDGEEGDDVAFTGRDSMSYMNDNDYFDDLDAGDTEMDRRSDLRRGW